MWACCSVRLRALLCRAASSGWPCPLAGSRPPAPGVAEKRALGVERGGIEVKP